MPKTRRSHAQSPPASCPVRPSIRPPSPLPLPFHPSKEKKYSVHTQMLGQYVYHPPSPSSHPKPHRCFSHAHRFHFPFVALSSILPPKKLAASSKKSLVLLHIVQQTSSKMPRTKQTAKKTVEDGTHEINATGNNSSPPRRGNRPRPKRWT
jgi:hypothetical protein